MRTAALLVTICSAALVCQIAAAAERYNLLVIQTDEHHYGTLGCYGGKIVKTTNIDWLAENGVLCKSFYATTPVCSPSRAALVSGMYPQKTPVVQNNIPLNDSVITFAELLRREGYATGFAGKWHLDGNGKPQWAPERKFGFTDNRFMFNRGHWKKFEDTAAGPRVGARSNNGQPSYDVDGADETTFATDWLANKAIDFIEEHADGPFCYMLSLPDPHGPNTVRAPYDTMYADVEVPIPTTIKRTDAAPAWGRPAGVTPAQLRRLMPPYYGMVKCIDDNIGRIIQALRKKGVLERTVIAFTSDHGDLCGEHGRLNKGVPYEGSARIPFILYAPGKITAGGVRDQALSCIDFLPTAMDLLGVKVPHQVDGRDAADLLNGKADDWNDIAFIRSTSGREPWLTAVSARYKLVYSAAEEPWLIDLVDDPQELKNRFADEKLRPVIKTMTEQLLAYAEEHHDEFARVPAIQQAIRGTLQAR